MPALLRDLLKVLALLLLAFSLAQAQNDDERRRAFQLYKDAKFTEALPLFEKLATANPNDPDILEIYGSLVVTQTSYLKDATARKEARLRGRDILLRAQKAGANSPLLHSLLDWVNAAGGGDDNDFSPRKEVDEAMREGEGAFANGEFPKAIEMYQRALLLDPKLYEAALFIGDVYFKTAEQLKAGEWFARAIAIDPDRETAYRYWGDSLMKQGKVTEAGDKFVEAFIAEPYNRLARAGFVNWGERVHISLAHPRVEIPANVAKKNDKETTITLNAEMLKNDEKNGSSAAWLMYSLVRTTWASDEFLKQYPTEKTYRHSLKEEAAAIRAALKAMDGKKGVDPTKVESSLQILKKLDNEGLLEPFILLAMPDDGIAKDFVAYRRTNAGDLRRYVKQYVLTGGGQ